MLPYEKQFVIDGTTRLVLLLLHAVLLLLQCSFLRVLCSLVDDLPSSAYKDSRVNGSFFAGLWSDDDSFLSASHLQPCYFEPFSVCLG